MEYDDRGNILERTFQDQGDGSNNRYDHFEYTDSTWGDLLTKYNNTTITYDAIGNPLSYRDGITMTWKNGRRLATYTKGDVSASFDYDADGLRTTKTVGTSRVDYYRAGGLLLGEVHTDGDESYTINYMYDESGRMLGFRLDGAEYYYVRDYSGDVTGLINARGELIGSYLYDPWGVLLETYLNTFEEETSEWTDADRAEYMRVLNLNPIRYKSYYYDTETGFYYLQSRYYDPITTRFINADGLISTGTGVLGYNMFAYCNNNPIMYSDPNGMRYMSVLEDRRDGGAASSQYPPGTQVITPVILPKTPDYDDYLDALGQLESGGDYEAVNAYGYLGKYQFGKPALIEAGFTDWDGNWTALANSFGVYSKESFLKSAAAQEYAITAYNKRIIAYIDSYGMDSYIGTVYDGVNVTKSGLVAACHLVGVSAMVGALNTGERVADGNNVAASRYMELLGGYDFSRIW